MSNEKEPVAGGGGYSCRTMAEEEGDGLPILWRGLKSAVESGAEVEAAILEADAVTKTCRRQLGDETKKLREVPMSDRGRAIGPLLKLYQAEIDRLIKRGTKASRAFSSIFHTARALHEAAATGVDGDDRLEAALLSASLPTRIPQKKSDLNLFLDSADGQEVASEKLTAVEVTLSKLEAEFSLSLPPGAPQQLVKNTPEQLELRIRRLASTHGHEACDHESGEVRNGSVTSAELLAEANQRLRRAEEALNTERARNQELEEAVAEIGVVVDTPHKPAASTEVAVEDADGAAGVAATPSRIPRLASSTPNPKPTKEVESGARVEELEAMLAAQQTSAAALATQVQDLQAEVERAQTAVSSPTSLGEDAQVSKRVEELEHDKTALEAELASGVEQSVLALEQHEAASQQAQEREAALAELLGETQVKSEQQLAAANMQLEAKTAEVESLRAEQEAAKEQWRQDGAWQQ